MSESTIHNWDPLRETQWNVLLRATTNIKINGYSVCTISVSVDVNYYRYFGSEETGTDAVSVGFTRKF